MGFIVTICFFVSDLIFPSISSAEKRKKIVIADVIVSGMTLFFYIRPGQHLAHKNRCEPTGSQHQLAFIKKKRLLCLF